MEGIKDLVEALKEFIWDVIGYFVPGIYLIILLSSCIEPSRYIASPLVGEKDSAVNFITVIIAYILGYLIYGIGEIKENILGSYSYKQRIQLKIKATKEFTLATELLQKKLDADNVHTTINQLEFSGVRSIAMGYAPDADKKVYTFMFRADLSRHVANTSFIIGLLALISCWIASSHPDLKIFYSGGTYIALYVLLLLCCFALNVTRNIFYKMAMRLPFQVFISIHNK